jgi:hypothetical protein
MALFNNLGQVVHQEARKNALNLQQQRQSILDSQPIQVPRGAQSGMVSVRSPDGTLHSIPSNEVANAIAAGGSRVG